MPDCFAVTDTIAMNAKLATITKEIPTRFFAIIVIFESFVVDPWQRRTP